MNKKAEAIGNRSIAKSIEANKMAGQEAIELLQLGLPVFFMDAKKSPHILRKDPNGLVREVEVTSDGRILTLATLR
jgi:hypothetical protein